MRFRVVPPRFWSATHWATGKTTSVQYSATLRDLSSRSAGRRDCVGSSNRSKEAIRQKVGIGIVLTSLLAATVAFAQWEPDQRLTNDPADSKTSYNNAWCVTAVDAYVHAVWYDGRDGNHEIYYKRNPTGNVAVGEPGLRGPCGILRVSPNPLTTGFATLRFSLPSPGPVSVAAFDALAVVAGAIPEPGELEVLSEVFVEVQGGVGHGRADGQDHRVAQFDRLARLLGVYPDDFEHPKQAAFEFFEAGVMFG